ncbi:ATP/GTP-binding protein [Leucobacter luti]|uniref:ATP/GTP-binding protein n=1 Tax=Leucobacter luti TaxID=340320 RepID=A0A4Q7TY84_9MICO|nr:ATP/GTP-binding protein [Leucobacter luti]MBL3698245.1 ATP/GTP-binding protein [Leucobacter luti]RZT64672.1 hypothetical protein EV139_2093 [Leucobacter luti]
MPRKHRRAHSSELPDVTRLANGGARRQTRRGREWFVREISAQRAEKVYRCPDCGLAIPAGQAHLVAWSAEHMFGDDAAVRERRHYHAHCWRLA